LSALEALTDARNAGARLLLDGDDLILEAEFKPTEALISRLRRNKAEILALLRSARPWSMEDWQACFDERAAIAEFDGGLSRAEAEELAIADLPTPVQIAICRTREHDKT
jgi:hypothetical protein